MTQQRQPIELAHWNLTPTLASLSEWRIGRAQFIRNQQRSPEERQVALAAWSMLCRQGIAWWVIGWNRQHRRRSQHCLTCQLATLRLVASLGQDAYPGDHQRVGTFEPYKAQGTADRDRYWQQAARTCARPSWIPSVYGQAVLVALAAARHGDRPWRNQAGRAWGIDRMATHAEYLLTRAWGR